MTTNSNNFIYNKNINCNDIISSLDFKTIFNELIIIIKNIYKTNLYQIDFYYDNINKRLIMGRFYSNYGVIEFEIILEDYKNNLIFINIKKIRNDDGDLFYFFEFESYIKEQLNIKKIINLQNINYNYNLKLDDLTFNSLDSDFNSESGSSLNLDLDLELKSDSEFKINSFNFKLKNYKNNFENLIEICTNRNTYKSTWVYSLFELTSLLEKNDNLYLISQVLRKKKYRHLINNILCVILDDLYNVCIIYHSLNNLNLLIKIPNINYNVIYLKKKITQIKNIWDKCVIRNINIIKLKFFKSQQICDICNSINKYLDFEILIKKKYIHLINYLLKNNDNIYIPFELKIEIFKYL